jgi:hypothetical protein
MEEISKMVLTDQLFLLYKKTVIILYVGLREQGSEPYLQYISYVISENRGIRSL